ncbi:MAG: dihydrofolate reductase family protein [bacterium]
MVNVIIHNAVSIDGRLTGFDVDLAQYYRLAGTWREDATLCGSGTILAAPEGRRRERAGSSWSPKSGDARPLLAIADSRGRVRCWQGLRDAGFWRDVVALCSERTPQSFREYLRAGRVDCIVAGKSRVDLRAALDALRAEYGVKVVRSDSGGTLNAALLDAGVVSEVSLLVHPVVAGAGAVEFCARVRVSTALKLLGVKKLGRGLVWLRWRAG